MRPLRGGNLLLVQNDMRHDLNLVLNPWPTDAVLHSGKGLLFAQFDSPEQPFEIDLTENALFLFFVNTTDLKIRGHDFNDDFRHGEHSRTRYNGGPKTGERGLYLVSPNESYCYFNVEYPSIASGEFSIREQPNAWRVKQTVANPSLARVEAVARPGYLPTLVLHDSTMELYPSAARVADYMLSNDD